MKFGARKPSIRRSISMKTKSRAALAVKKAVTPAYESKGKGAVTQPKKSLYNKAYSKTTFSWFTTRTCWNPGVSTPGGRQLQAGGHPSLNGELHSNIGYGLSAI